MDAAAQYGIGFGYAGIILEAGGDMGLHGQTSEGGVKTARIEDAARI
ncbi:hypothetical protein GGI1_13304, partial [Acidithiobacillus sp. GGI-221]